MIQQKQDIKEISEFCTVYSMLTQKMSKKNLNKGEKWKTGSFWQCKCAMKIAQILTGNKPMHQNFLLLLYWMLHKKYQQRRWKTPKEDERSTCKQDK